MVWFLYAIGAIAVFVVVVILTMYFVLRKSNQINYSSEYILNKFEPDNTAPKITELIEFHRENDTVKYIID